MRIAGLIVSLCLVVLVAAAAAFLLMGGGKLLGLGGGSEISSSGASSEDPRAELEAERGQIEQMLADPLLDPAAQADEADLVEVDPAYAAAEGVRLDADAAKAFADLMEKAAQEGVDAGIERGYAPGQEDCADDAHGGYSADLMSLSEDDADVPFEQTVCFIYLKDNGAQYGIISEYQLYLDSSADRNPAHYRYVGTQAASFIYENNLSLSEYREVLEQRLADIDAQLNGENTAKVN